MRVAKYECIGSIATIMSLLAFTTTQMSEHGLEPHRAPSVDLANSGLNWRDTITDAHRLRWR